MKLGDQEICDSCGRIANESEEFHELPNGDESLCPECDRNVIESTCVFSFIRNTSPQVNRKRIVVPTAYHDKVILRFFVVKNDRSIYTGNFFIIPKLQVKEFLYTTEEK